MKRLLVVLIALGLLGCSGPGPTQKSGDPNASKTGIVRVLTYEGDPVIDALISAFYQQNQQIRVEKVFYPVGPTRIDGSAVVKERLRAGEIDIFPNMAAPSDLLAENLILALDPFVTRSGLDLKPLAGIIDPQRIDGKLYMLPAYGFPQVIFYNVDMFTAAGLPLPKPGWTWDEFRTAAAKLTSGSDDSKIWGIAADSGLDFLASHMRTELSGRQAIEPQAAKEILRFWSTMVQTDKSMTPSPKRAADGTRIMPGVPRQDFQNRKAAMTMTSLNTYAYLRGVSFKFDIAPVPVFRGASPAMTVYPNSFGIAAGSPNADAAWEFLQFMLSEAGGIAMVKTGYFPMVRTEAVKQAWFDRQPTPPRSAEHFFDGEISPLAQATDGKAAQINLSFSRVLSTLLQGESDPEELHRQFMAEREKILSNE